jgi:uncharacterized phage protein (TIGR01671 family)
MTKYIFRGKRVDNGEWIYGNLSWFTDNSSVEITRFERPNGNEKWTRVVDAETVGQYVGLCDKNGNKVFEGDILCYEDMTKTKYYGVVKYGRFNCSCCHGVYGYWIDGEYLDIRDLDTAYVVGNIHDNPELLEVEE